MTTPYADELALALRVVHAASLLTKSVLRTLQNKVSASTKSDSTPVTSADFASQALMISALHAVYPTDSFIGEEDAGDLRRNAELAERVWGLVRQASEQVAQSSDPQHVQDTRPALTFPTNKDHMLDVIDLGTGEQTRSGRVWVMDPVDGTSSFMTNKQYAVCLCLLVDGVQQVAVIGCPNLKFDVQGPLSAEIHEEQVDDAGYGVVLSAVKGQGTFVRSMHARGFGGARRIEHAQTAKEPRTLRFIESALGKTSLSQEEHSHVASELGATWPGCPPIWSSQIKWITLSLGGSDALVRIPINADRYTAVWDHAGGQLLFQEAGGIIKDTDGKDIDFGQGRLIRGERNFGMVAANGADFDGVMQAVQNVLERRNR